MAVSVQFEIGHTAKLRAKKTPEGFTHDWELYVRGSNKADISAYVEKVVFNLHESFQKPKRVYKEPPYVVLESGYASFVLTVDIHFRNRDEPKRVQYPYDLDLQPHGPPHHRSEEKRFVFENPSEEFRQKLLKGGGVPVVPAGLTGSRSGHSIIAPSSFTETNVNSQQTSTSNASKHKSNSVSSGSGESSSKKHKSRTDDTKLNTFANLFGPPDPSSKNSSSKSSADVSKNPSSNSGKTLSPNAASGSTSAGKATGKDIKEKQSSSSSAEKTKDKSERKEKHKSSSSSSPSKDGRSDSKKSATSTSLATEIGKSEKQRGEDKPKKDKNRDKDRDRSSSNTQNTSSSSAKSTNSSKSVPITGSAVAVTAPSQRASTHGTASNGSSNRSEDKITTAPVKTDKETKEKHSSSSSSGKKSKKDKKDKDKDREKEKDKEKRDDKPRNSSGNHDLKSKEERSHSSASQSNISGSPSGQSTPNSSQISQAHAKSAVSTTGSIAGTGSNNTSVKKSEKDTKSNESTIKKLSEKIIEKPTGGSVPPATVMAGPADKKTATPNSSNSSSTKSHKHKKKDKNKDKDKDKDKERNNSGDKEKTKEKHKEKVEDKKEIDKSTDAMSSKVASTVANDVKKPTTTSQSALPIGNAAQPVTSNSQPSSTSSNTIESGTANKKSQSKEKKSKDSKISKDIKRRSDASTPTTFVGGEPKSKTSKTSTPVSTELSDADSRQSAHESISKTAVTNLAPVATADLHSESSNSSFPDIPVKLKEKSTTSLTTSITSSEKSLKAVSTTSSSKENKREKEIKMPTKSAEKTSKAEKEDKKRRRNTVTIENTFIEPPVKQAKKEQNKSAASTRESTKSPLPSRSGIAVNNTKPGKVLGDTNLSAEAKDSPLQQPAQASPNATASPTATPTNANTNSIAAVANHVNSNNSNNVIAQRNSVNVSATHPASPALSSNESLWPNLSELQELHHKIMTLQDNQDLQQIVEMIAASGCYEVTQRTFDFDLCKLDRGTVERLQEFFATSVS